MSAGADREKHLHQQRVALFAGALLAAFVVAWLPVPGFAGVQDSNPNRLDEHGQALLCAAARDGDLALLATLLDAGGNIDIRGGGEHTPLMAAASYGEADTVRYLLTRGADRTLRDAEGLTAADRARANGHAAIVALLEAATAPAASPATDNDPARVAPEDSGMATAEEAMPAAPPAALPWAFRAVGSVDDMVHVYAWGVEQDLAGAYQLDVLRQFLTAIEPSQVTSLAQLLEYAGGETHQVLVLKSMLAGEPWEHLVAYATEIREVEAQEVIRRSTMRDPLDLVQQWQDSCGPAMLQVAAGEHDPRYAWELNKLGDLTVVDPHGQSAALASQQREWLERYGGRAVLRGETGQGISILDFLNEQLGPMVGLTYNCLEIFDMPQTLDLMDRTLRDGRDMPLCITFNEGGNHFVLALNVRGEAGSREFLIHDTWTARTEWVPEAALLSGRFDPFFATARLTYYYIPTPTTP